MDGVQRWRSRIEEAEQRTTLVIGIVTVEKGSPKANSLQEMLKLLLGSTPISNKLLGTYSSQKNSKKVVK